MINLIIYPSDVEDNHVIDDLFTFESTLANKYGSAVALINYDEFKLMEKDLAVTFLTEQPEYPCTAVYRGFPLTPERYNSLYEHLKLIGIKLINNPTEYANTHHFNNSYEKLMNCTPKIAVFNGDEIIDWDEVRDYFHNKFIIKDFDLRNEIFDFTYTDKQLDARVAEFKEFYYKYRGIVILQEYVEIQRKFKALYYKGRLIAVNSLDKSNKEEIKQVKKFAEHLPKLDSHFYALELALTSDNKLIVLNSVDGQYCESSSIDWCETLYEKLFSK